MRLQGASFNQKVALAIFFPVIIFYLLYLIILYLTLENGGENATKGSIFPFFLIGIKTYNVRFARGRVARSDKRKKNVPQKKKRY
ncbi:hypothetical protein [Catellicoccus marimammalium]|uniref:hypothetical protein n=1 Tax=Catellicoccus marimammalium TaxID=300419 RepID=UPI0039F04C91